MAPERGAATQLVQCAKSSPGDMSCWWTCRCSGRSRLRSWRGHRHRISIASFFVEKLAQKRSTKPPECVHDSEINRYSPPREHKDGFYTAVGSLLSFLTNLRQRRSGGCKKTKKNPAVLMCRLLKVLLPKRHRLCESGQADPVGSSPCTHQWSGKGPLERLLGSR